MTSFCEKLRAYNAVKPSTGKAATLRTSTAWLMDTVHTPSINRRGTRTVINGFTAFKADIDASPTLNEITKKAFLRAKESQVRVLEKKEKRKLKMLSIDEAPSCTATIPAQASKSKKVVVKCRAIGLTNKPCPYRASCGEFCKRHAPK